jgi:hypothetical protein
MRGHDEMKLRYCRFSGAVSSVSTPAGAARDSRNFFQTNTTTTLQKGGR